MTEQELDDLVRRLHRLTVAPKFPEYEHPTDRMRREQIVECRDAITALRAEVAALRKWNADMVAKVAEGSLDGYRELGAKCAALEAERDALRRVVAAADAMLENMHE